MINLRPATIDDLELLKYWDAKPHVRESIPDSYWNWETELLRSPDWREQLIAELNGEPIGFVQIIDPYKEETHYWGDVAQNKRALDIWIGEEKNLDRGYGTQIMKLAIDRCFRNSAVTGILIDPLKTNVKAIRFYEKLGFEFLEERKFDNSVCLVYELKRRQKKTWFTEINSRILKHSRKIKYSLLNRYTKTVLCLIRMVKH